MELASPNNQITTRENERSRRPVWPAVAVGLILGLTAFICIGGLATLNPHNIQWLLDSPDPRTHYLGWCFFRAAPWSLPPGLNPAYGMAMGSSIVYSDSIPIMALLLKPFSPWLAAEFQYTGIWLLLSLLLQGVFAMLLGRRLAGGIVAQGLVAGFLVLPSVLLQRLNGHYALAAQWMVLWAIWLYLQPPKDGRAIRWAWVAAAALASLIHLYLAVMVVLIWHGDLLRRWMEHRSRVARLGAEYALVVAITLGTMWTAGYFVVGFSDTVTPGAAGAYGMNLASPLDPRGASLLLNDIPLEHAGQIEGSCYLGLGVIVLGLISLMSVVRHGPLRWHLTTCLPLLIVCLGVTLFAVSPLVTLGPWKVVSLPNYWGKLSEVLRASGRMIWPVFYILNVAVLATIISRFGRRMAIGLLAGGLCLQMVDLSPAVSKLRQHFGDPPPMVNSLKDRFWTGPAREYRRVVFVPAEADSLDWFSLARFAAQNRMLVNYGYFARYSWHRKVLADEWQLDQLRRGQVDYESLYVICDETLIPELEMELGTGMIGQVDGYWIIAPRHP